MMQNALGLNQLRAAKAELAGPMTVSLRDQAAHQGVYRSSVNVTDLAGLSGILRRRLSSILAITAVALALSILYLAVATPIYSSSATLFIDPRTRKIVSEEVIQGGLGTDLALVESQVSIIGSDTVLRRVVDTLGLASDPEFAPPPAHGFLAALKDMIRGPRPQTDPATQALVSLSRNLRVKRAQKTYIVEIEVFGSQPAKTARIANAVAEAYLSDQSQAKSEEAKRANALIDARLGELRDQLRNAEMRVDEFKKANKILTSEGGLLTEQQGGKLNAELATARAVAAESKARYDETSAALAAGSLPEALPEASKSGLVQKLREQYAQIARREASLATQLGPRHPALIEVRSQIGEIRDQIAVELKRIAATSKSEYDIAANRERGIAQSLERVKEEVARTNTAQIKLRELEQEADASRELMRVFLARAKETQEQTNLTTPEARIISTANAPTRPVRPASLLVLALGLLGGASLGVGRALLADHLDKTVHFPTDAAGAARTRALGALPEVNPSPLSFRHRRRLKAEARRLGGHEFAPLLAALSDARGETAVPYRQAALRILDRIRAEARPGRPLCVLLAGSHTGSGTSAAALSLAHAAALAGDRVLLVDACSRDAALATALAGDFSSDEVVALDSKDDLARITVRDEASGLALLPIALADLRLLKTQQRRRLATGLSALAQDYDLVLIDAGAPAEDQSASGLFALADQIVLVARAGLTTRERIAALREILEPARDRILGVILTRITHVSS